MPPLQPRKAPSFASYHARTRPANHVVWTPTQEELMRAKQALQQLSHVEMGVSADLAARLASGHPDLEAEIRRINSHLTSLTTREAEETVQNAETGLASVTPGAGTAGQTVHLRG